MATYTNSPLVDYTLLAPRGNYGGPRNHIIDTVAVHCVVGQASVETIGKIFANPNRKASSNYGVGYDGRIGLYCEEKNRSYCTSSGVVDHRAVTIEVASDAKHPYAVTDAAYNGLIKLLADICKRNNIKQLIWKDTKSDRVNRVGGANMMVHRDWAAKACLPTKKTEVLSLEHGWISIEDVHEGDTICISDQDTQTLHFETVTPEMLVPCYVDSTLTYCGLEATPDHRVISVIDGETVVKPWSYYFEKDFEDSLAGREIYLPVAGTLNAEQWPVKQAEEDVFTFSQMALLAAFTSNQFHFCDDMMCSCLHDLTEAQANVVWSALEDLELSADCRQLEGGKLRVSKEAYEAVTESFVNEETGVLEFAQLLVLPQKLAQDFLNNVKGLWLNIDGKDYSEYTLENLNVIAALAAVYGVSSCFDENHKMVMNNSMLEPFYFSENATPKTNKATIVTCLETSTGAFLCRQDGSTFIVGNCPGDYLYERHQDIANKVNALLDGSTPIEEVIKPEAKPDSSITNASLTFRAGEKVRIASGAMYYNGKAKVPDWVIAKEWYLAQVTTTDKVIIGKSVDGANNINSAISARYLIKTGGDDGSGGNTTGTATEAGKYTLYTVKKGDTLSGIAKKYNTTTSVLTTYNKITDPNKIYVGQEIKIPL